MIPIGYMYKSVVSSPDWLQAPMDVDIRSVSNCISPDFTDYVPYWKHNGYWLFDSPRIMEELAAEIGIDLSGMMLFYYEAFEYEFGEKTGHWSAFGPEASFRTDVETPASRHLQGFDVVTFFAGNSPECSPLSCNGLAVTIPTNRHCLFDRFDEAKDSLDGGLFVDCEPGPYRIIAVYTV